MSSKKDKKDKKSKSKKEAKEEKMEVAVEAIEESEGGESSKSSAKYAAKAKHVTIIAKPLASRKTTSKLYSVTKKAAKEKLVKRGVKEVAKAVRKGERGLCIIAGDISPLDVITHLPVMCEEKEISYIFVPSKDDLGAASLTKRPTSCVLISVKKDSSCKSSYDKVLEKVKAEWKNVDQ